MPVLENVADVSHFTLEHQTWRHGPGASVRTLRNTKDASCERGSVNLAIEK